MAPGEEAVMSDPSRVQVTGPLAAYVAGFRDELAGQGYRPDAATGQLQLMAHASRWLAAQGLQAEHLSPAEVERFVECRRSQGYRQRCSSKALVPLLRYLQELGTIAVPVAEATTPVAELLERYRSYLVGARGLAPSTTRRYLSAARAFLSELAGQGGELDLNGLSAGHAVEFVGRESRRLTPASAQDLVNSLRSLLRFLAVAGIAPGELAGALPAVAVWGGGSLPQALASGAGRCSCGRALRSWASRRSGCRASSGGPASAAACRVAAPIGFVILLPPRCCRRVGPSARSARCSGTTRGRPPPESTPRSTGSPSARSPSRGRKEVRRDLLAPSRRRLPGSSPFAGFQAGASLASARRFRRLPPRRRRHNADHRACGVVGESTPGLRPGVVVTATGDCARVRPPSSGVRPRHRGTSRRPSAPPLLPADSLSVSARGDHLVDDRGEILGQTVASRHLRDPDRADRGVWTAAGRGPPNRLRRRRLGRGSRT